MNGLRMVVLLPLLALIGWSLSWAEFNGRMLLSSGPRFTEFFTRLVPPDWSVAGLVIESTIETLMIALAGTSMAVVVSIPLGILAASNVSPPWLSHPVRWFLGFIRSIPLIVVAMLFVVAVGLGPFPGTLAIAFHSIGMLGKFYAEEFETADPGIVDAVQGTGATWMQTLRFGLLPQCIPQILSFTVFRFEMNFRDAAVLGLVGAGGIGYYIQLYVRGFQYEKVAVLLLVIIVVVWMLDQLTFFARRWIR
jgi:phosphonate transport system permease protein